MECRQPWLVSLRPAPVIFPVHVSPPMVMFRFPCRHPNTIILRTLSFLGALICHFNRRNGDQ